MVNGAFSGGYNMLTDPVGSSRGMYATLSNPSSWFSGLRNAYGTGDPVRLGYSTATIVGNTLLAIDGVNSLSSMRWPRSGGVPTGIGTAEDFGIPKFLNPRQDLHIPPVTDGRSVLTANPSDLLQGLHNGDFTILRQPKPGQVVVDFGKPIGEYWSNGTKVGETQFGSVSYGKKGAHIIPANPNQW